MPRPSGLGFFYKKDGIAINDELISLKYYTLVVWLQLLSTRVRNP